MQVDQPEACRACTKPSILIRTWQRMPRTDSEAQQVMSRPNVIFRTVPETCHYERVRTTKSDAPGLPCVHALSACKPCRLHG